MTTPPDARAVPDPTAPAAADASRWTVLRSRVCLAGRVTAADGTASRGGRLLLVATAPPVAPLTAPAPLPAPAPAVGRRAGRRAAAPALPSPGEAAVPPVEPAVPTRAWEAPIRPDGRYWFFDVPAGDYLVSGRDERGRVVEARTVSLPPVDVSDGKKPLLGVDLIAVPPAAVPLDASAAGAPAA